MVYKKIKGFNSCCCNYHVQMVELKDGYNSMLFRIFHQDCTCTYDVYGPHGETTCVVNNIVITSVKHICEQIVCSKGNATKFHNL